MTDSPDYRLHIETSLTRLADDISENKKDREKLHEKLDQLIEGCILQTAKLDKIEDQTTRTNSRVLHLETESNNRQVVVNDFRHLEAEFKGVRDKVEKIDKDLLEVWFFKKYPKIFIGVVAVAIFTALVLVKVDVDKLKDMVHITDQKVNLINVPMRTRGGEVVLMPAEVYMDSLNQNIKK